MNRIEAKDIRAALPVADYAERHLGLELRQAGKELRGDCPLCGASARLPFCIDVAKDAWFCQVCRKGGDVLSLAQEIDGVMFSDALRSLAKLAGIDGDYQLDDEQRAQRRRERAARQAEQQRRNAAERAKAEARAPQVWEQLDRFDCAGLDYLRARGVAKALTDVRFDAASDAIAVPLRQVDGRITNVVRRYIDPAAETKVKGLYGCGTGGTFGDVRKLGATRGPIIVVEGVFDWLSARTMAPERLVLGANGSGQLVQVVQVAYTAARSLLAERGLVFVPHLGDKSGVGERHMKQAQEFAMNRCGVGPEQIFVFDVAVGRKKDDDGPAPADLNDYLLNERSEPAGAFDRVRSLAEIENMRNDDFTDAGNAQLFAHIHGDNYLYAVRAKDWQIWNGRSWAVADTDTAMVRASTQVTEHLSREATMTKDRDPDRAEAMARWAHTSRSQERLNAMYKVARSIPSLQVDIDDLDSHPFLLTVENGTLDLRTGELGPHRREHLITQLAPVAYDRDAKCPRWDRFISEVFEPNPDAAIFVQRYAGYTLTADTSAQCLMFCQGGGGNGKGVLFRMLQSILGPGLTYQTSIETFMKNPRGDNPKVAIAQMRSARMVLASETENKGKLNETLLKAITGGDLVTGEEKYKPQITYQPRYKLWISSNPDPQIECTDDGFWRRFKLVKFLMQFDEKERDDHLEDYLKANERPGILRWATEGALAWHHDGGGIKGLGYAESLAAEAASLRNENDDIGRFIEERCFVNPNVRADSKAMYREYTEWANESGLRTLNNVNFGRDLKKRSFIKQKSNGRNFYKGVGLLAKG